MQITLENIGKKFNTEWIFRGLSFTFEEHKKYAITGHNGSGKSTLLQVLTQLFPVNEGLIKYEIDGNSISIDHLYKHFGFAAPYMELVEELSLIEFMEFHAQFKKFEKGLEAKEIIELMELEKSSNKLIKQFSSGMKQRLKLGLAFFSSSQAIFLDEPTTNLDNNGINWYLTQISKLKSDKLVIISSNDNREYQFCDEILDITNYKKSTF